MWPALIAAGGSIAGGLLQNYSAREEAKKNRQFQERMSSSAWQRGVKDMEAAGVNPALAYSKGPATSPGGSMATQTDAISPGVSSGMQAMRLRKELKLLDAQIAGAVSESRKRHSEANITRYDEEMTLGKRNFYFDIHGRPKGPLLELLQAQHGQALASSAKSVSDATLAKFSIPEQEAIAQIFTQYGESGKGLQLLMPMLLQILRRR